jgi:hypothetical protein
MMDTPYVKALPGYYSISKTKKPAKKLPLWGAF